MADALQLMIGSEVDCEDGVAGKLHRLIVDPTTSSVTHLDVETHHVADGRLVPVDRVRATDGTIHLECTLEQFTHFLPDTDVQVVETGASGQVDRMSLFAIAPMFGQVMTGQRMLGMSGLTSLPVPGQFTSTPPTDVVPEGDVDLRGGAYVIASDGHIGHIHGVVVDKESGRLTHLLLGEGHVFSKKEVAIPFESVTEVSAAGAHLSLSKAEVEALPPVGA